MESLNKYGCIVFLIVILIGCTNRRSQNESRKRSNSGTVQTGNSGLHKLIGVDGNVCKFKIKRKTKNVRLLGIHNNLEVEKYLKRFIGQKMELVYDSSSPKTSSRKRAKTNAYVTTEEGVALNSEIIKKGFSLVNPINLKDSLASFLEYQKSQYTQEGASKLDIVNLKKASFRVDTYNASGTPLSFGSGFFISSDGYAMSNHHVFENGSYWEIKSCDTDQVFRVDNSDVIEYNKEVDFILFKIPNLSNINHLSISNSRAKQGDEIYAYGNPEGLNCTLSKGIVAAFRSKNSVNDHIQIDAPISPGSSGGPIVNSKGQLIGISTSQLRGECQNCNFGLNIHELKLEKYKMKKDKD